MNKGMFNAMTIEKQVEYVNRELKQGSSLTKVAELIGIRRNTIRDRFGVKGYKMDETLRQYILVGNVSSQPEEEKAVTSENRQGLEAPGTEDLLRRIKRLEDCISRLDKKFLAEVPKAEKFVFAPEIDGEVKIRTYKIYDNVAKKFDDFVEKVNSNKEKYLVQDLISLALWELVQKYDK